MTTATLERVDGRQPIAPGRGAMRRVLMVSPHFPPDSSAASHRVRILAPYLPDAGWEPTVLTVDPSAYEGRLDEELAALVPRSIDVVRAPAWSVAWTRRIGIGDLGVRAWTGLHAASRRLLSAGRFDAIFITVYPVYPALLGGVLKQAFGVPFVVDYQDPWVGEWGRSVGGARDGSADWKSRASRRLGVWLEPHVVNAADGIVAVSQGTIDGIAQRIPRAALLPQAALPVGFDPGDFERLRLRVHKGSFIVPPAGEADLVRLCYVGTMLPTGDRTLRLLLAGLAHARAFDPAAQRLRLHFVGTSNQSSADRCRVLPVAREYGLADVVAENPGRIDYLDALSVLAGADGVLLLGSADRHYTASKLFPALLSRRPILALFHRDSSVVEMLRAVGREPTVRAVTYDADPVTDARVREVGEHLVAVAKRHVFDAADVNLDRASEFSAPQLARRLGALLDRVAA